MSHSFDTAGRVENHRTSRGRCHVSRCGFGGIVAIVVRALLVLQR